MADDRHDLLVGDDAPRVGHADIGFPLVVEGHQLHPETHLPQRPPELLDRELRAEPDRFAARTRPGQRALGGDPDDGPALGGGDPQRRAGQDGQDSGDPDEPRHRRPLRACQSPDSRKVVE